MCQYYMCLCCWIQKIVKINSYNHFPFFVTNDFASFEQLGPGHHYLLYHLDTFCIFIAADTILFQPKRIDIFLIFLFSAKIYVVVCLDTPRL